MEKDQELLLKYIEQDDKDALNELFGNHYPSVYQVVHRMVNNEFDARDITQSAFLKVLKAVRQYRGEGKFRSWILKIALNEAREFLRNRSKAFLERSDAFFEEFSEMAWVAAGKKASRQEFEQALERGLETLSADVKAPLILHYYQELPMADIADILGSSQTTVWRSCSKGIDLLRKYFKTNGLSSMLPLLGVSFAVLESGAAKAGAGSGSEGLPETAGTAEHAGRGAVSWSVGLSVSAFLLLAVLSGVFMWQPWTSRDKPTHFPATAGKPPSPESRAESPAARPVSADRGSASGDAQDVGPGDGEDERPAPARETGINPAETGESAPAGQRANPVMRGTVVFGNAGKGLPGVRIVCNPVEKKKCGRECISARGGVIGCTFVNDQGQKEYLSVILKSNFPGNLLSDSAVKTETDGRGEFSASLPSAGDWEVFAMLFEGRGPDGMGLVLRREARLEAGGEAVLEFACPGQVAFAVVGSVKDDKGRELPETQVQFLHIVLDGSRTVAAEVLGRTSTSVAGEFNLGEISVPLAPPQGNWTQEITHLMAVRFAHPDHGVAFEHVAMPYPATDRPSPVVVNAVLCGKGAVTGTLVPPGQPRSLQGQHLRYLLEDGQIEAALNREMEELRRTVKNPEILARLINDAQAFALVKEKCAADSVPILDGNRFVIRTSRKGALILEGQLGATDLWIPRTDLGQVDPESGRDSGPIRLEALRFHDVAVLEPDDRPSMEYDAPWARFQGKYSGLTDAMMCRDGRIRVPVNHGRDLSIEINGYGVKPAVVRLPLADLPQSVRIERHPVILEGCIDPPPSLPKGKFVMYEFRGEAPRPGGRKTGGDGGSLNFDPRTGEFRIYLTHDLGQEAVYKVTLKLDGHAPWVKEGIRFNPGEPPERVAITFRKY